MKKTMCRLIEKKAGFAVKTPADFSRLAEMVMARTGSYISDTTLKRLFGYIEGWQNPRPGVWNILSRFVGFANEDDFRKGTGLDAEAISGEVKGDIIRSADIATGAELELRWYPDRFMRVRHEGRGDYLIMDTEGTRLRPGGLFHADSFISREALLLNPYSPPSDGDSPSPSPILYEIGRTGGIDITIL